MRFSVFGRFQLEVLREDGRWNAYRRSAGIRVQDGIVIPAYLDAGEIAAYLDDIFHEAATPGDRVERID